MSGFREYDGIRGNTKEDKGKRAVRPNFLLPLCSLVFRCVPSYSLGILFLAGALAAEPNAQPLAGRVIVLDPGHAVFNQDGVLINPGARGRHGPYEREVALDVAEKMCPLLESQGAKVFLTRTRLNPWRYSLGQHSDNRSRALFANSLHAQAYIRLHCDWNRSRHFQGYTAYYYRWTSRALAKTIHDALVKALPDHHDNGIHRRTFVSISSQMPTVLVEMGVLSYKPEAKDLASDAFQDKLAIAITQGVVDYFRSRPNS